jgi:hypothetical protein
MSLYYFHLVSRKEFIRDYQGNDFSELINACCHAKSLVQKAVSFDVDWRGWSIRIVDVDGRSIVSVLFPLAPQFGTTVRAVRKVASNC